MEEVHDGIEDHGKAQNRHGANGHRLPFSGRNHFSKREPGELVISEGEPYDEYAQKSDDYDEWIDGFFQTLYLLAVGARRVRNFTSALMLAMSGIAMAGKIG
jgi:hypothetical protein